MNKKMETTTMGSLGGGNQGMEKNMETTTMGYLGPTMRTHSFIPS